MVAGVVGGCGTTTLATRLGLDEVATTALDGLSAGDVVVLVAPNTAHGSAALVDEVSRLTEPDRGVRLFVAVCADGRGPTPRATRARLARMRSRVHVHQLPWVASWRWSDRAAQPDGTRSWQRTTATLLAAIQRGLAASQAASQTSPVPSPPKETNP